MFIFLFKEIGLHFFIYSLGLRAEIHCTRDPVIKKLFSSLLKSYEIFKNEEAAAKLIGSDFKGKQVSGVKSGRYLVIAFLLIHGCSYVNLKFVNHEHQREPLTMNYYQVLPLLATHTRVDRAVIIHWQS